MSESRATLIFLAVGVAIIVGLFFVGYVAGDHDGYRTGTIDAMTGHPGYVLTTQPTGETVWVKK